MGVQILPGAASVLGPSGLMAANSPVGQIVNGQVPEYVAQILDQSPVARTRLDTAVTGPATGVPYMQQPYSYSMDVQYGVRLPQQLVGKFMNDTPLLDRVLSGGQPVRPERAAVYGLFDAASFTSGVYGDFTIGSDPPGITTSKHYGSVVKKSYGAMASITDVDAIASSDPAYPTSYAGETYTDDRALLLSFCTKKTLRALEYSVVKGNSSSRATQFDGVETALTYDATDRPHVWDRSGASTGTIDAINAAIFVLQSKGIQPTELWMHPLLKAAIVDEYLGKTGRSINITQGDQQMTLGQDVGGILTAAGRLPIFTSYHFTLAGSAPNLSGDIYIMSNNKDGVPLLSWEWMVTPRAIEPLARVPGFYTSSVMGVWCHGVFFDRSGWWAQARLKNCGFSFNTTTYPVATLTAP